MDSWATDAWTDPRWDDIGVGEIACPDGNLYLVAATTERPSMPATGRYASNRYQDSEIVAHVDLEYGTATNYLGQTQSLRLDLHVPPSHGTDRPLVILVHGGGFANGDKSTMTNAARSYARRGYVAATLGYRLNPTIPSFQQLTEEQLEDYLEAARNAVDDGMESVRWLRDNAATYEIEPDRIAMLGTSAGGGIALGVAVVEDATPGGPLGHVSPRINAAVATGATLALALDEVAFDDTDSPIMMIHYEYDTATTATDQDVRATCMAVWDAGGTCDEVILPGEGHGSPLGTGGPWWTPEIGPYLWEHLDL